MPAASGPSIGSRTAQWTTFADGAERDRARGARGDGTAHGVSSALRRLCRNAGRDRSADGAAPSVAARPGARHRAHHVRRRRSAARVRDSTPSRCGMSTSRIAIKRWPRRARAQGLGYLAAVRAQLFCELGDGAVDFAARQYAALRSDAWYDGWIVVEQDVFPWLLARPKHEARNADGTRREGQLCAYVHVVGAICTWPVQTSVGSICRARGTWHRYDARWRWPPPGRARCTR